MIHLLRHFQTKKKVIGDAISGKKRIIETVRAKSSMGLVLFFLNAGEIQEVRVLSTPRIVGEFLYLDSGVNPDSLAISAHSGALSDQTQ